MTQFVNAFLGVRVAPELICEQIKCTFENVRAENGFESRFRDFERVPIFN